MASWIPMRGLLLAACAVPLVSAVNVAVPLPGPFGEALAAQNLIGSHFGPADQNLTYDYLIVGGGTAGLVLANRLAANASNTVAVIEAGGFYEFDNGNFSQIPGDSSQYEPPHPTAFNPLVDWIQFTTTQAFLGNRSQLYTQGKTFGGGSARNSMWYQRSSRGAYQKWADEVGDQSYTFDNLLPFFKKSINFTEPSTQSGRSPNATVHTSPSSYDPKGGPLQVSYWNYVNGISQWLANSLGAIGLATVNGFVDGNLLGWSYIAVTVDPATEMRSSSESSFLRQSLAETTNLAFYKSTLAKKLIFNEKKRAIGVLVNTAGVQYQLSATREVIVSAGAFRSPQLLMVSGIGPKAELDKIKVDVVADLPGVGQNLMDNIFSGPTYPVNVITHNQLSRPEFLLESVQAYNTKRQGILTNSGGDILAFEKIPATYLSAQTRKDLDNMYGPDWPDVEYLGLDAFFNNADTPPPPATMGQNFNALLAGLVAPFSRGNVSINSTDTAVNPMVNPKWLADPRDREVAVAGFKRAREVFASTSIKAVLTGPEAYPGANFTSDAEILGQIQLSGQTIWHAAGTNKMGKKEDKMAVVDALCRVYGVDGLRVVDASAFPFLPPGHPQGTVYALAEKVSEDILQGKR